MYTSVKEKKELCMSNFPDPKRMYASNAIDNEREREREAWRTPTMQDGSMLGKASVYLQ